MNVSVFGGSQPQEGDETYSQAFQLGMLLGKAGHTVLTGGYIGTMEAVSRGAAESGALVVGVTCDEIESWRAVKANPWVKEERHFKTLLERLTCLVRDCEAAIALPGGPGTLTEIALTWNMMIIQAFPRKPLILVGCEWKEIMDSFTSNFGMYIPADQRELLSFAPTVEQAVHFLQNSIEK
jgi:uncharacterized protein (TIGR00730 family)